MIRHSSPLVANPHRVPHNSYQRPYAVAPPAPAPEEDEESSEVEVDVPYVISNKPPVKIVRMLFKELVKGTEDD